MRRLRLKTKKKNKTTSKNNKNFSSFPILIIICIIIIILYLMKKMIYRDNNNLTNGVQKKKPKLLKKINKIEKHVINYNPKVIIDDYFSSITSEFEKEKEYEKQEIEKILSFSNMSKDLFSEAKNNLMKKFYSKSKEKKNITTILLTHTNFQKFGNKIIYLNNLIYYCEILGFKNIYLSPGLNWFINNSIVNENINISVVDYNEKTCSNNNILCLALSNDEGTFLFYQEFIKPEIRIYIIKNEIKRNLPYVTVDPNDLYIHIRSGDIFTTSHPNLYAQPPFCFYETILNNFPFNNVNIIAMDNKNPVINKILEKFKNVNFITHSLEIDIAYLVNAYNLVASVSSFFVSSIKFNDNLQNCWEYDIYHNIEKLRHLHYDFYQFNRNYTIYKMKPSQNYRNQMYVMSNKPDQLKLMIEEKCENDFIIIK